MRVRSVSALALAAALSVVWDAAIVVAQEASSSPGAHAADEASALPAEGFTLLDPGRYTDASVGRSISFTVGEGWTYAGSFEDAGLVLIREEPGEPYFAITRFGGIVFSQSCATEEDMEAFIGDTTTLDVTAEAFMGHLAAHPYLTVQEPVPVEIGGFSGLQADMEASVPPECTPPWAWLWVLPVVGDYHLSDGTTARIVALDADGQLIVVVAEVAPEADLTAVLEHAIPVIESLEIGPPQG